MDERPTLPTDRRRLLKGFGFAAGGWFLPEGLLQDQSFVLEQGDTCVPVEPLSGRGTAASYYDYKTGQGSRGTTALQREDTSILFLYRGPERLNLFIVHGKMNGRSDGGSATFRMTGLPEDGEWVVRDDDYNGSSQKDDWDVSNTSSTVDWTWVGSLTDGGVFAGLGDDFEVRIEPRFNDAAAVEDPYGGTVTSWELLSGDTDDPERTELDMSEPVVLRTGSCDGGSLLDDPTDDEREDGPGRREDQDGGPSDTDDAGSPDDDDEPGRREGQDGGSQGNDDPGPPEDAGPPEDDDDEGIVSVEADDEGVEVDIGDDDDEREDDREDERDDDDDEREEEDDDD